MHSFGSTASSGSATETHYLPGRGRDFRGMKYLISYQRAPVFPLCTPPLSWFEREAPGCSNNLHKAVKVLPVGCRARFPLTVPNAQRTLEVSEQHLHNLALCCWLKSPGWKLRTCNRNLEVFSPRLYKRVHRVLSHCHLRAAK